MYFPRIVHLPWSLSQAALTSACIVPIVKKPGLCYRSLLLQIPGPAESADHDPSVSREHVTAMSCSFPYCIPFL